MSRLSHINPPEWLERNILFRKLFLLRKLYLTHRKFHHYSGAAEDVSIRKLLQGKRNGFFVDVGCYHPVKYNNTWALYRKGWRGVNIDSDEIKIELFRMARRHDVNITCAVSDREGTVKYYRAGLFSQINTINEDETDKMEHYITREVPCRTLTSILDNTIYKDKRIDVLSVDVEGHEYEVITALDFARYAPSLIVVEIHKPTLDLIEKTELYQYLRDLNYTLVGWCGESLLMASQEFQSTLINRWK